MNDEAPITLTGEAMDRLARDLLGRAGPSAYERTILGIAGIPGSGKSTLALRFAEVINNIEAGTAALAPMDGFHLSNAILNKRGLTDRKGAPSTFDIAGYLKLLRRCRDAASAIRCPHYDRTVHEPVCDDHPLHLAGRSTRIVVTEGNYLLLDEPPWSDLADILTITWWLMQRHAAVGRLTEQAAQRYANDLANTRLILDNSRLADRIVNWPD
ncbi:MAG: hypothetical protein JSV91_15800 [Phycisphaerales bacterium]|nr:MAG: hypothetical protein JSV91_15800 [Phycisphaerales bacterium]